MISKQRYRTLELLKENGFVTTKMMMDKLGIASPRDVIYDLRKLGHCIISEPQSGENRYGEQVHFNKYKLGEGELC
jgi:hypothetical protein